jgi:hypothetical protein
MTTSTATTASIPTAAPEGVHYTTVAASSGYSYSIQAHEPTPRR